MEDHMGLAESVLWEKDPLRYILRPQEIVFIIQGIVQD